MKVVLTAYSFLRGASGSIGETIEVADSIGYMLIDRGVAKEWQPPGEQSKSVNERLAEVERELASLKAKDGKS